ncbi:unnamed protein product, partial [Heterosigma akashiwo]
NKIKFLDEIKSGRKQKDVAFEANVAVRTLRRWQGQEAELRKRLEECENPDSKKAQPLKYPRVDAETYEWATALREAGYPLSGEMIQMRAESLAEKYGYEDFKHSNGWLDRFLKRHNMRSANLHGEGGDVDEKKHAEAIGKLKEELADYDPDDIYNMDETGLFFKLLPKKTYLLASEDKKNTRGTKAIKAKDRVTLIVCCNATGTDKVPLVAIGKAKEPRCFKLHKPPIKYLNNKTAWNNSRENLKWLHFFAGYIRRIKPGKVVVLIMDNCGAHGDDSVDLEQLFGDCMVFKFLPPNMTARFQPCDAGIIAVIK